MFSTSKLYHELKNFRKEIEQYIDSPEYVESYILHSSDGKIFDADGLKDHLRDNPIKTDAAYNDIYLEANKIIDIYNEFENKNVKQWSNNLIKDEKLKNSFFSNVYVQAISTANGKFTYHNYIDVFTKEHEYQDFTFDRIYHICIRILNILYHFGYKTSKPKSQNNENTQGIDINSNWFQVGLLFANGEIENLIKKNKSNFSQIAKNEFGDSWSGYRPYISETYNNTSTNNKNIWRSNFKICTLHNYCLNNSIKMSDAFLKHFKSINEIGT
jgi:hypothetical protein